MHELDLLAIAFRERAHFLVRFDLKAIEQYVAIVDIDLAVHTPEEVKRFFGRELRPQRRFTRDISNALMRAHGLMPGVDAEERGRSTRRFVQSEQATNRGCLAGPVRAEKAVYLSGRH